MMLMFSADTIPAIVAASQVASDLTQLTADLALARDDGTGVYGDACRYSLANIEQRLAVIRECVNALPVTKVAA